MEQSERLANKFANMLKNLGVQRGNVVFAYVKTQKEIELASNGATKFGANFGVIPSNMSYDGIKKALHNSHARLLLVDVEFKPTIDQMRKELPELWSVVVCNVPKGTMPEMSGGDFIFEDYFLPAPDVFYDPRY